MLIKVFDYISAAVRYCIDKFSPCHYEVGSDGFYSEASSFFNSLIKEASDA